MILLLRRAGYLKIHAVHLEQEKYLFELTPDSRILHESEESVALLQAVRDQESQEIWEEANLFLKRLEHADEQCLSRLFNETYELTEEYCAGCNCHEEPHMAYANSLPLRLPLRQPPNAAPCALDDSFGSAKDMMLTCHDNQDAVMAALSHKGLDGMILPKEQIHNGLIDLLDEQNATCILMDYEEFFALNARQCEYFLSGTLLFVVGSDEARILRLLRDTANRTYRRIYLMDNDFYVESRHKYISEMIRGIHMEDYIIL